MITLDTIKQAIRAAVDPLRARVNGIVRRGTLTTLDNATKLAAAAVRLTGDKDTADAVEMLNPVGISSRPAKGAEVLVFAVGGNPRVRVAIPFVRGQRLLGDALAEGELAMYIGVAGQVVHLKLNGDVVVTPGAGGKVLLGDGAATKRVALAEDVDAAIADIRTNLNTHVHGGVTAGMVSSAVSTTPLAPQPSTASDNVYGKG